ncbi:MAG: DUF1287 domain-containing protein [Campylobacteraceae bacterium]|jgi:uncharacterized protein YijF (DUF1287 family)|nr:DUF1287 domain-containing protein [Campylobacteraceae bacterium]
MKKIVFVLLLLLNFLLGDNADFTKRLSDMAAITNDTKDYAIGDIVAWSLESGSTHIGIVVDRKSSDNKRYMIVHNIGLGQIAEDCLFCYKIIGHYAYEK